MCTDVVGSFWIVSAFRQPFLYSFAAGWCMIINSTPKAVKREDSFISVYHGAFRLFYHNILPEWTYYKGGEIPIILNTTPPHFNIYSHLVNVVLYLRKDIYLPVGRCTLRTVNTFCLGKGWSNNHITVWPRTEPQLWMTLRINKYFQCMYFQ